MFVNGSAEKYCRGEVKIGEGLVGRGGLSLVWGREIPSREAMAPFWNPLRGESILSAGVCPLLQPARNSYAVGTGKG